MHNAYAKVERIGWSMHYRVEIVKTGETVTGQRLTRRAALKRCRVIAFEAGAQLVAGSKP